MIKKLTGTITLLLLLLSATSFIYETNKKIPPVCLSSEELTLYDFINEYRVENGLSPVILSKSLTYVAQVHAKDLSVNRPFVNSKCNMHSWSENGKWSPCCYTSNHKEASCMWDKPKELTHYKGHGYEIAHGFAQFKKFHGDTVTAINSLDGWKNSTGHNNVILNKSSWDKIEWNAIGIGIYKDFSCVWFGQEVDTEDRPEVCE